MNEECDFDTLSAMIESDEEFESQPEADDQAFKSKQEDGTGKDTVKQSEEMDSSDDDIAEDDLDKLACLVEEEYNQDNENPEAVASTIQKCVSGIDHSDRIEHSNEQRKSPVVNDITHQESSKIVESVVQESKEDSDQEDGQDEDLAAQLKMMQQQMKLLESKIKKKKNPKEESEEPRKERSLKEINIFEVANNENQQPWDRKKTQPLGTISSMKPKVTKHVDKSMNTKLKNTVDKISNKLGKCVVPEKSCKPDPLTLDKELFGDDSGSDWEDMDGEKNSRLSKKGQEIKKIMKKSSTSRVAHEPGYDQEKLINKKHTSWENSRPNFYSNKVEKLSAVTEKVTTTISDVDFVRDPFSGIRIINPRISSLEMKSRMAGRRLIKMSHLYRKVNTSETDTDWVTIGVLVSKSEPKTSSKGTQYSIWKLSDLDDCDKLVTLMLFGSVHKDLWKSTLASVVGLLNPSFLKNTEKYQKKDAQEVTLTMDSSQKLMLLGSSKDFGTCTSKTKAGRNCNNVINRSKGEYCTYHVQAAYKKVSAKRSELQAGFSGVTPKSFEKKLFGKTGSTTVIYGGQSFTTGNTAQQPGKKNDQISLKELQHHTVKKCGSAVTTLKVQNLASQPMQDLKDKEKIKAEKHKAFHSLLTTPTVGSINFVRYLSDKDNIEPLEKNKSKPVVSVSAREFFKNAQRDIQSMVGSKKSVEQRGNSAPEKVSAQEALKKMPCLGRGLSQQPVEFDFDSPPRQVVSKMNKQQFLAKRKAIAKVNASGGIKKEDPNAVKSLRSPETQAKLKRRLEEAELNIDEGDSSQTPSKKRSRLLGDLDMDNPEVRKLLSSKSAHSAALTEEEEEKQNRYFEVLEKKEAMEEKMGSITKMKCKAVTCKKCKYTAFSGAQLCKDEGHPLLLHDAVKRFFQCKICKLRTVSLDKLPKFACKNCGSSNFVKTTMLKEKKGPKLPGEDLLLRGEERKYVNS